MTLATRCSACGTSFRVVQDQLKVSGGWVRCGRCNEVFNALESLYEIEAQSGGATSTSASRPEPPSQPPPTSPPASPARMWDRPSASAAEKTEPPAASSQGLFGSVTDADPAHSTPAAATSAQFEATTDVAAAPSAPMVPAPATTAAKSPGTTTERDPPVSQPAAWVPFGGVWPSADEGLATKPGEGAAASTWSVPGAGATRAEPAASSRFLPAPSEPAEWDDRPVHGFEDVETRLEPRPGEDIGPTPSFLQQSSPTPVLERADTKRWKLVTAGLAGLLVLQIALAWRDSLAARAPVLEPALSFFCKPFACKVAAPRNLSSLTLETSNLRQRGNVGSSYDFIVTLRNRSVAAVMWPSFELTLTDSQGQALIRRVLSTQDFGLSDTRLGPAAEVNLSTQLDVADRRIAGYTVEIFYP